MKLEKKYSSTVCLIANTAFTIVNFRAEVIRRLVRENVRVIGICPATCSLMPDRNIAEEFAALGAGFIPIELQRNGMNPVRDISYMLQLTKILKKIAPNLTLNYTVKPSIYGSLAARAAKVPVISSNITGIGSILADVPTLKTKIFSSILIMLYKMSLKYNRLVFFQNPDDLDYFKQAGILKNVNTKVINGSGVNLNKFQADEGPKTPHSFIFVGRFLKDKGVHEYIQAANILAEKYPQAVFSLLGQPDENPKSLTIEDIEQLSDKKHIVFINSQKDVRPVLGKHQVMVLPSYREGTPRSILEAMAMGMPIVTTDAPGCRETVENGKNGFLVPVRDITGLAAAMEKFILEPDLIPKLGTESRNIAEAKFDENKVVESILVEFKDVL